MPEHHIVVVVKSDAKYLDVMTTLLAAASKTFGVGCEAHGYDPKKRADELAKVVEERNLAMTECHRLRCEAEAARVALKKR